MDRNMVYAGVSVVLAGLLGFSWAQDRKVLSADDAKPMTADIAVVDMVKVFEANHAMTAKRDEIKREAQRANDDLKLLVEAGKKLQEELKLHKPGSTEHNRIQKELQDKAAEIQKFQKDKIQALQQEEAEVFQITYKRVMEEVQRIAEARNLRLVLRYQAEATDAKDPKKLLESMNRIILYQNGLDITDEVIQGVN